MFHLLNIAVRGQEIHFQLPLYHLTRAQFTWSGFLLVSCVATFLVLLIKDLAFTELRHVFFYLASFLNTQRILLFSSFDK